MNKESLIDWISYQDWRIEERETQRRMSDTIHLEIRIEDVGDEDIQMYCWDIYEKDEFDG